MKALGAGLDGGMRVVEHLLRLAGLSLDEAPKALMARAVSDLLEGHAGVRAEGGIFPEALVGSASGEGKPFVLRDGVLRTARIAAYEEAIFTALEVLAAPLEWSGEAAQALDRLFPVRSNEPAEVEPRRAAEAVLGGRLALIVGGPGRGKTFTLKRILAVLFEEAEAQGRALPRVRLAAPTGKAAARMREAIEEGLAALGCDETVEAALRELQASTLHRLLGLNPDRALDRSKPTPRPVDADVVVIDEASMIDLPLFARLLSQLEPEARLVLLGDPQQLAPVGVGSVLADLVGAEASGRSPAILGLPARVARLTVSYRFGPDSGIGRLAAAIESGDEIAPVLRGPSEDLTLVEPNGSLERLERAVIDGFRGVSEALAGGADDASLSRALSAFDAHRVLALGYEGERGVDALNEAAVTWLERAGLVSRRFDGVASIHPVLVTENDPSTGLMNGDVGLVVTAEGRRVAAFLDERTGGVRRLAAALLPAHQTAFAMTVHKAQGSQFDHVSLVFPRGESRLATRELFYTGVTRAKRRVTLHAELDQLERAARGGAVRVSGLYERVHPRTR